MLINWLNLLNKNVVFQQPGIIGIYAGERQSLANRFTDDFIAAATADFRCPKAMVEVTWANTDVDINRVISSNDINRIDRTGQLFNGETTSGYLWAYLHSGLIADGSFKAMPELDTEPQMGWYGQSLVCDGAGDFSTAPYLEITHLARSYSAVIVSGDSWYDEYPVDFSLTFTHPGGPTVINVTGNTERVYSSSITTINDATAIRLTITKWSEPNTIVKINQFAGALIELYKAEDIVELSILEETNSDTGTVPIGNVSANELDLSLKNTGRRFSYGNTDSPYNSSLRSGRKIRVWLGFVLPAGSADATGDVDGYIVEIVSGEKIGYMPYGIFWSKDWISSHESPVTTTTAYDIIYKLSQKDFLKSEAYTGTVETIVDSILTEARNDIPDLQWSVSPDTGGISWILQYFEDKSYLDILKDIAEETLSYTYVDRNGTLVIGSLLQANTPLEAWQKLDLSDYFNFTSKPRLDELINTVRVGYFETVLGTVGADIYSPSEVFTIPASGTMKLFIKWSSTPVFPASIIISIVQVSGSPLLTASDEYAYGGFVTITGTPGDTFQLSATGTTITETEHTETTAEDEESILEYGSREFSITGNRLIRNSIQAQRLADSLVSDYGNLRQDASISWPASTLISVGDTLEVVEFKSATVETKSNFLIKRQNITYDGALIAETELRRG